MTRVKMSDALRSYLKEWNDWRLEGAPHDKPYIRGIGLCHNACRTHPQIVDEISDLFEGANCFPFGEADYYQRSDNETQHLCPKRIAWVEANLPEAVVKPVHFYPQGAIQTIEEANRYVGQTLFMVHGLGSASFMQEETPTGRAYKTDSGSDVMDKDRHGGRIFLGDRNIGCHHNDHYLFHNRGDADAYLAWAKTNTSRPNRGFW